MVMFIWECVLYSFCITHICVFGQWTCVGLDHLCLLVTVPSRAECYRSPNLLNASLLFWLWWVVCSNGGRRLLVSWRRVWWMAARKLIDEGRDGEAECRRLMNGCCLCAGEACCPREDGNIGADFWHQSRTRQILSCQPQRRSFT